MCFEQRQIAIVDLLVRDTEVAFPMFCDGDIFRLDVAAREAVSELAFWLDGVLEEKERGCQHSFVLFVCLFLV